PPNAAWRFDAHLLRAGGVRVRRWPVRCGGGAVRPPPGAAPVAGGAPGANDGSGLRCRPVDQRHPDLPRDRRLPHPRHAADVRLVRGRHRVVTDSPTCAYTWARITPATN